MSATITAILGGLTAGYGFISSLVGESWARYFFILAGLSALSGIAAFTGFDVIQLIVSSVISNIFGVQGFIITALQLTILIAISPLIFFLLKIAVQGYSN